MTSFPGYPRLLKGGIVLIDPNTGAVQSVISLQYNPETVTRTLQVQGVSAETGDRQEQLRLKGPPIELYKLDAEIDATDQLESPDQNQVTVQNGIYPQLAALETIIYPTSDTLNRDIGLAQSGTLEIIPMEAPVQLFVWSAKRIVPVRITEFSVTEEMFDANLNPIRAKVSLGLRVLSVYDLESTDLATSLYMTYQQQKERLAALRPNSPLSALGITSIT